MTKKNQQNGTGSSLTTARVTKQRSVTNKLTLTAVFVALGVLFPQLFHFVGGQSAGSLFLPMHIPVLLCGFMVGATFGAVCGLITPILSFAFFSMPPLSPPILPIMIIELAIYGFSSGFLFRKLKLNANLSLILSMILGRIGYLAMFYLLIACNFNLPTSLGVFSAIATGLPGICLQLAIIPLILNLFSRQKLI